MKIPVYFVDAFTKKLFSGNPAAVIFSNDIDDEYLMQNIAAENNLSETAFINKKSGTYNIRWFAPSCEIDLCGHATLASAFVYFNFIEPSAINIRFLSLKNGFLDVNKKNNILRENVDKYIKQSMLLNKPNFDLGFLPSNVREMELTYNKPILRSFNSWTTKSSVQLGERISCFSFLYSYFFRHSLEMILPLKFETIF